MTAPTGTVPGRTVPGRTVSRRIVMGTGMAGLIIVRARAGTALTMATGEPGGGFAVYGPQWGQIAARTAGVTLSYRASGGSAANILLVEQDAAQIGLTTMAVADQAWLGRSEWTGYVPLRGFRVLFPIYQASWQVFTPLASTALPLTTLNGRRIGVGPAGGASAVLTPALLAAADIVPRLTIAGLYGEQIALLRARKLDACAFIGVPPLPALRRAATEGGFDLIGVNPAQRAVMQHGVAGMTGAVIPRTALPRQTGAVATMGTGAIAIGRADLPDALVGALTEAALSRQDRLIGAGMAPPSGWIDSANPVAIHPGAAAALRRHGYAVPARLVRS